VIPMNIRTNNSVILSLSKDQLPEDIRNAHRELILRLRATQTWRSAQDDGSFRFGWERYFA